jgi:CheY-like chemotaxis protein
MSDQKPSRPRARVLDIGQCTPDHSAIRSLLNRHFEVEVDRVMFVDEALSAMRARPYDLVLVNRLIFDDNSEGRLLIEQAKADARLKDVPIMLISNYADAQQAAEALGAVRGFGKSELHRPDTVERLAEFLPAR